MEKLWKRTHRRVLFIWIIFCSKTTFKKKKHIFFLCFPSTNQHVDFEKWQCQQLPWGIPICWRRRIASKSSLKIPPRPFPTTCKRSSPSRPFFIYATGAFCFQSRSKCVFCLYCFWCFLGLGDSENCRTLGDSPQLFEGVSPGHQIN